MHQAWAAWQAALSARRSAPRGRGGAEAVRRKRRSGVRTQKWHSVGHWQNRDEHRRCTGAQAEHAIEMLAGGRTR